MSRMKLNQGYYRDGLDRCLCVVKIIGLVLKDYPVIDRSAQLTHLIQGAYIEIDAAANLIATKVEENNGEAALDRAYWMFELINELLIEHPLIAKDREARIRANQAANALWKLYQILGKKL